MTTLFVVTALRLIYLASENAFRNDVGLMMFNSVLCSGFNPPTKKLMREISDWSTTSFNNSSKRSRYATTEVVVECGKVLAVYPQIRTLQTAPVDHP